MNKSDASKINRRLFIAIELPSVVLQEIELAIQALYNAQVIKGRFTPLKNVHITLKFLGYYPENRIDYLKKQLDLIAHAPFTAQLGSLDYFSHGNKIAVVFAHIRAPECVILAQKIDEVLIEIAEPESRTFVPHVTLARVKEIPDRKKLIDVVMSYVVTPHTFVVDSFILKESILSQDGVKHHILDQFFL